MNASTRLGPCGPGPVAHPMPNSRSPMKKVATLLIAALMTGCANVHVEGTEASSTDSLAKLVSVDRRSRLVAIDGTRVNGPVIGSYYVKPGNRLLRFQLQIPNSGLGKGAGHGVTAVNSFVDTRSELKAGTQYFLHVEQNEVVIREQRDTR